MKKNSKCQLSMLGVGDAFVMGFFRKRVYRIMGEGVQTSEGLKIPVNIVLRTGEPPLLPSDKFVKANTKVRFLRHTTRLQGRELLLEDLEPGDTFKQKGGTDIWLLLKKGKDFYRVHNLDGQQTGMAGRMSQVIFLKSTKK